MRRAWVGSVIVLAALGACGGGGGVDVLAATVAPGVLPTPASADEQAAARTQDDPDPLRRSGPAGQALQCDGPVYAGAMGEEIPEYGGGKTPRDALKAFVQMGTGAAPNDGYTLVRQEADRALFTYAVNGRAKVALTVVTRAGPYSPYSRPGPWVGEAWAVCDPAEFDPRHDRGLSIEIWSSPTQARVPVSVIQTKAPSPHCWAGALILRLATPRASYLRDPRHTFREEVLAMPYDPATTLPADAVDTGYFRGDRHLWLAADQRAAYVVTAEGVELWPKIIGPSMCA